MAATKLMPTIIPRGVLVFLYARTCQMMDAYCAAIVRREAMRTMDMARNVDAAGDVGLKLGATTAMPTITPR